MIHTIRSREVIRRLLKKGWKRVHVNGSHQKLVHPWRPGHVVVPHPRHDLSRGALRSIHRQAGWPFERES